MFNLRSSIVGLLAALFLSVLTPAQFTLPDEVLPSMAPCDLAHARAEVERAVSVGFLPGCNGCELWSSAGAGTGKAARHGESQTFSPISGGFTITATWFEHYPNTLWGACWADPDCVQESGCGGSMTLTVTAVPAGVTAAQFVLNIGGQIVVVTYPSHVGVTYNIDLPCKTGDVVNVKLDSATVDGVPVHVKVPWMMMIWCTSCQ